MFDGISQGDVTDEFQLVVRSGWHRFTCQESRVSAMKCLIRAGSASKSMPF